MFFQLRICLPLLGFFVFLWASALHAADPVNALCPVTPEEPVEKSITVTYKGQTVALCCKSCLRKFNRNPEAYVANLPVFADFLAGPEEATAAVDVPPDGDLSHASPDGDFHGDSEDHAGKGSARAHAEPHIASNNHDDAHPRSATTPSAHAESHSHAEAQGHAELAETGHGHAGEEVSGQSGHDHATDHGLEEQAGIVGRLLAYLGKLHVLAIHLPVAFLPVAALCELIGWFGGLRSWIRFARGTFLAGSVGALVAAALGWLAARGASYPGELAAYLEWHRWWGTSVAGVAFIGLVAAAASSYGWKHGTLATRVVVLALGFAVPITAHLGGSLIYGADYLF